MKHRHYDFIVVGAGPAGLSAARTLARLGFRTLILERYPDHQSPEQAGCALVAPIPGFVSALRRDDGSYYFPALDLCISASQILGQPVLQRFISPHGYEFQVDLAQYDNFPVLAVDKQNLLIQMAEQAGNAGAELAYGQTVVKLLWQHGRISGVVTAGEEQITAEAVLSAEGMARTLVDDAGLYFYPANPQRYVLVMTQELEAPAAASQDVGQILTLGRRQAGDSPAFGTIVVPAAGRAIAYLTILLEHRPGDDAEDLWQYLNEYVQSDPRVRNVLDGARVIGRNTSLIELRDGPIQVVRDGFMGVGDAVTPAAWIGLLPAIYLGRQAALVAAEALDGGDTSAECLATYQQAPRNMIMAARDRIETMWSLAHLRDEDLSSLYELLGAVGYRYSQDCRHAMAWETLSSLTREYLPALRAWDTDSQAPLGWGVRTPNPSGATLLPVGMINLDRQERVFAMPARRRRTT
jgi:flavin-dependent dehydrogenase